MRILFIAAPVAGHTLPLIPLAWAARLAGHDILFATSGEAAPFIVHAGLSAVEVAEIANIISQCEQFLTEHYRSQGGKPIASWSTSVADADVVTRREEWSSARTFYDEYGLDESCHPLALFFGHIGERAIDPIVHIARAWGAHAVVYEPCMVVGLVAAKAVGIPAFCHGLGVFHPRAISAMPAMIKSRKRYGLANATWEPMVNIDVCPKSIGSNPLNSSWPMRYTPYNKEAMLPEWLFESYLQKPRVCVTLGTSIAAFGNMEPLEIIINALSNCDIDVIVLGAESDVRRPLPDNIRSTGWLPLNAVLPTCSAIIHHGGAGSTFTSLAAGVPQLIIPQLADQPTNAAAVVSRGVGIYLAEGEADTASVHDGLFRLLDNNAIYKAAAEVRKEIAAMPSPSEVADRIITAISKQLVNK